MNHNGAAIASSSVALASHRTLPLEGGQTAILADRSTGWCILTDEEYRRLLAAFANGPLNYGNLGESEAGALDSLWECGLLLRNGQGHPDALPRQATHPSSLLLKLTGACNFDCTYCYDYDKARFKTTLSFERAAATVEYLLSKREHLSITFHGGEPLLQFPLMQRLVAKALDVAGDRKRLRFSIQTNASLLSTEVVSFFDNNNFAVGISLDGYTEHANSLRVVNNPRHTALGFVTALLKDYPEFVRLRCGFLAVATKTSIGALPEFALWLQDQSIAGLGVSFLDLAGKAQQMEHEKPSPDEAVALFSSIIDLIRQKRLAELSFTALVSRVNNLFTFQPRDFCHKGPCAAGDEFLVLDSEGRFRTCDCIYDPYFELAGPERPIDDFRISPARLAVLNRHDYLRENGSECRGCPLFGLCGGTCVAKAIASNGAPDSVNGVECAISKYIYPVLLSEFAAGREMPLFDYYRKHKRKSDELVITN